VATFGFTGAATSSYDYSGVNTDNEILSTTVTVPENARCQSITVDMGGHTAAVNTQFCIWNASGGGLLVASAVFSAGLGRATRTASIADTVLKAGQTVWIGFWRDPSKDAEWGVAASGSFQYAPASGGAGSPSNPISPSGCSGSFVCGSIQAYVTYIPILTWKGVAGAWKRDLTVVGRSSAWSGQAVPVKVGRAGAWNQIG